MISIRKKNPTLVHGDYKCYLVEHPDLFIFNRWDEHHNYWVLLNLSDKHNTLSFNLPEEMTLLINNYEEVNAYNELRPWESKVYKVN